MTIKNAAQNYRDETCLCLRTANTTRARKKIICVAGLLLLGLSLFGSNARAQSLEAHLRILSLTPPRISIEGARDSATTAWSFRTTYAGLLGLGARIEQLALADAQGAPINVRQLAPGEYEAAQPARRFRYEVRLDPPAADADAAHVSWLTSERGVLMPGDLLPLPVAHAKLRLTLPDGWQSIALDDQTAAGRDYEVAQAESSMILIGPALRRQTGRAGALTFTLAASGEWAVDDGDIANVIQEVLQEHARATGTVPRRTALVIVAPFPRPVAAHVWSAETRGGTVLMLSGRMPGKTAALVQLSMPLAHELFHLWVPNGLPLAGDYAWFFEGFTLYQSVRAGVRLGYLSFQNYLDNLALAYDRSRNAREASGVSLLDASRRRWSDPAASVYYRGMLAAYLYDLQLRRQTNGKRSTDDIYHALFHQKSATNAQLDANSAVLELMNNVAGSPALTERYIKSSGAVELTTELEPFGLQVASLGARTRIIVAAQLSRAQRDLLKQIGYNQSAGRERRK